MEIIVGYDTEIGFLECTALYADGLVEVISTRLNNVSVDPDAFNIDAVDTLCDLVWDEVNTIQDPDAEYDALNHLHEAV